MIRVVHPGSRIQNPGVKKAPDPGSETATLVKRMRCRTPLVIVLKIANQDRDPHLLEFPESGSRSRRFNCALEFQKGQILVVSQFSETKEPKTISHIFFCRIGALRSGYNILKKLVPDSLKINASLQL